MEKKLLVFSARYCGKCHTLKKGLKRLFDEHIIDFEYEIIDVETEIEKKEAYFVDGIPTIVYLKNNQEVERLKGTISKDMLIDLMK